ncbi:hypothetical protein [uncultured Shewanella sp.]|uniref:hypothetical protein n=1 Tax=uncultured Shewanella sp. TaxID=173975 RepID=UPI00262C4830|nr:hypothetical protein [uncultured Shewanella sp.]
MENTENHPFQEVINELKENNVRITGSENAHKLLFKLCKFKEIRMNGSPATCAKNGDLRRNKVIKQAKGILAEYKLTGLLILPVHFKQKGRETKYKHDGNATANRNLWNSSNRAKADNHKKPVLYSYNSKKA